MSSLTGAGGFLVESPQNHVYLYLHELIVFVLLFRPTINKNSTNKPITRIDLGAMWHGRSRRSAETKKTIIPHVLRVARIGILRLLRLGRVIRLLQLLRHFAERISIEKPWNPCATPPG